MILNVLLFMFNSVVYYCDYCSDVVIGEDDVVVGVVVIDVVVVAIITVVIIVCEGVCLFVYVCEFLNV